MDLSWQPIGPWHGLLTAAVVLCLTYVGLRLWRLARKPITRKTLQLLNLLLAVALIAAIWNPVKPPALQPGRTHLVLLLDVSESVLRAEGGWPRLQTQLAERVQAWVDPLPPERKAEATADIITFAGGYAFAKKDLELAFLDDALRTLAPDNLASGEGSQLETALAAARNRLERMGCAGAVLLASDGNQTRGDALLEAKALARQGFPVHVLPLQPGFPKLAITAANLPNQVFAGNPSYVRGLLRDLDARTDKTVQLTVGRNLGLAPEPGQTETASATLPVIIRDWARLRQPVVFEGLGIQYVELALEDLQGNSHRRRLFTHVARPPRLLVIGGDFRWVKGFPRDVAELVQIAPESLPQQVLSYYDAVVLSAVSAERFPPGSLETLAQAVTQRGLGLFFIHGEHYRQDDETPTLLASYTETPIAPILPVKVGPRPYTPEPQPRQIVIMVDTSGSMAGDNLDKAKQICRHVIGNLLRPQDTLDLLTFTTGVGHLIRNRTMDPAGIEAALAAVEAMTPGGGTDPRGALQLIANRKMTDCGLIFISDGMFQDIEARPDCVATVFAIGQSRIPAKSPLHALADPFPVDDHFDPTEIRIPYFEPEPRTKFYERAPFTAFAIERFLAPGEAIPMPSLELPGSGVSHLMPDAELIAARPKLTDPILAYRNVGRGRTGIFMSRPTELWTTNPSGQQALGRWLSEVVAYTNRDRYLFKLQDQGERIDLEISLTAESGSVPAVDQLELSLDVDGTPIPLRAEPDPLVPGCFRTQIRVTRQKSAQQAFLVIRELGPASLTRVQRVPFVLPQAGLVSGGTSQEAQSYGIHETLLRALCDQGGGLYHPTTGEQLLRAQAAANQIQSLRAYPLIAALCLLFLAFALRRWEP